MLKCFIQCCKKGNRAPAIVALFFFIILNAFDLLPPVLANCGVNSFYATPTFPVVQDPTAAAVGDFNNDGIKDLAITSTFSSAVGILLGRSSGGFGPIRLIPVQAGPSSIVVGYFDRDRNQDLAVTNFFGVSGSRGTISVLIGNGQGNFVLRAHIPTGTNPVFVAAADITGDGILDLAVTNYASNDVVILRGDGAGNFPNRIVIPTNDKPRQIAVGRFNNDDRIDLAVLHDSSPAIVVFLGNRSGGFDKQPPGFDAGSKPTFITTADFNLDGNLDLAVSNFADTDLSIMTGNVDGTFRAATNFPAGRNPSELALADFNRDDSMDFAVVNMFSNKVTVLTGDRRGGFVAQPPFSVTERPIAIVADDFNGDSRPDLLVISRRPQVFGVPGTGVLMLNTCGMPNLALTNTPGSALSFTVGRTQYYSFSVINKGSGGTSGTITLRDELPTGLTFREATGTGWTCSASGRIVTCTTSQSISPGATSVLTMTVDVAQAAIPTAVNNATVVYTDEVIRDDNSARLETAVLPSSDLEVEYTNFPATVEVEHNIVYVIALRNIGPSPAVNVVLSDVLPESLEFVSASPTVGSCTGTNDIRCNFGDLGINTRAGVTITARAKKVGTVDNTVVVRGGNADLNSSNNSKTATTTINKPPSL